MNHNTIQKVINVAKDYFNPEKGNASRILAKQGIFIDIACIRWQAEQLEKFGSDKRRYLFGFDPLLLDK